MEGTPNNISPSPRNDLGTRVRVLEVRQSDIRADLRSIHDKDLARIEGKIEALADEIAEGQRGMTRPEKIALAAAGFGGISAIVTAAALLAGMAG